LEEGKTRGGKTKEGAEGSMYREDNKAVGGYRYSDM
jgi:hypothetical protein